uniref:Uncharacterized protein n=1 Tax=Cacopsylla melanoneura TaxID=428564 RepID=A0A8D8TWM1_9HEMI
MNYGLCGFFNLWICLGYYEKTITDSKNHKYEKKYGLTKYPFYKKILIIWKHIGSTLKGLKPCQCHDCFFGFLYIAMTPIPWCYIDTPVSVLKTVDKMLMPALKDFTD